jgi:proline iminopeptidase
MTGLLMFKIRGLNVKVYSRSGYIKSKYGKIWYKILGKKGIPIICINGGPGGAHDYLEPLEELSKENQLIFYDSLGCGRSDQLKDKSLWTIEYFVEELGIIVKQLSLTKYYILGHSWGTAVAVSFAAKNNKCLKAVILSDPFLNTKIWEKDAIKLIKKLPKSMQSAINIFKNNGKENVNYRRAAKEYYYRFVFRMNPLPKAIKISKSNKKMYNYMWGSKEYISTGTLKNLDLLEDVKKIKIPVLLLCGKYDEATPSTVNYFKNLFSNARIKVFKNGAHFPFFTDKKEYLDTVSDFIKGL